MGHNVLSWPMLINWFDHPIFDAWEIAARRRHLARPLKGGDSVEAPGVPSSSSRDDAAALPSLEDPVRLRRVDNLPAVDADR
jgi:hypothetical protein